MVGGSCSPGVGGRLVVGCSGKAVRIPLAFPTLGELPGFEGRFVFWRTGLCGEAGGQRSAKSQAPSSGRDGVLTGGHRYVSAVARVVRAGRLGG